MDGERRWFPRRPLLVAAAENRPQEISRLRKGDRVPAGRSARLEEGNSERHYGSLGLRMSRTSVHSISICPSAAVTGQHTLSVVSVT